MPIDDKSDRTPKFFYDRHAPEYRHNFESITEDMHRQCPIAWSDTYGGHWVASGHQEVFEIARNGDYLSSAHDPPGDPRGFQGVTIPVVSPAQSGFIEMDPPEQRQYRQALNPYLSPAAVARWTPVVDELVRASLDDKIEGGHIDFVDDLANIVPAVLTLAMTGLPLQDWRIYCQPAHAAVYTPPTSPEMAQVLAGIHECQARIGKAVTEIRQTRRPGLIDALIRADIGGTSPTDQDVIGAITLVIGGGFDTTTALTAHSLNYLSQHREERERLSRDRQMLLDSATEEFLRYFTPAPGNGRTIRQDCEMAGVEFKEGERLWLSWAMANRDPKIFPDPNTIDLERKGNRHSSFGLGVHRCIGSNMARMAYKRMLTAVLDRMPDYVCDPSRTVHYETIGVIQGMRHLPATFTPSRRIGAGVDETVAQLQKICDEQRLAEPVTTRAQRAEVRA